ncbi:MAG: CoA-binding protein [Halobacteriota archaeon]|nr:CoA-binding protein [Halobacteriota archaeon]
MVDSDIISELDFLFHPKSIAVIGASRSFAKTGSMTLFSTIAGGFTGKIFPINPKESKIMGLDAYPNLSSISDDLDLAMICVPSSKVPGVIEECVDCGVKVSVIISSGFGEIGEDGKEKESEIVEIARRGKMRLVGPNCMGVGSADPSLYSSMNFTIPMPGNVSIVSQSGTITTLSALESSDKGVGISKYISSGNEADLHIEDFITYFADDPETKLILAFIEGLRDGRRFFEVAKEVTKKKPLIVLKGGKTKEGAGAASSHTGSLAGSYALFDAMSRQAGISHVSSLKEMTDLSKAFSLLSLPKGRKVAIVSAQGGLGVLMADACVKSGLELPDLSNETIEALNQFLPYFWSHRNPIDLTAGINDFGALSKTLEVVLKQPDIQSVICLAPSFSPMFSRVLPRMSGGMQKMFKSTGIGMMERMEKHFVSDFIKLKDKYQKPVIAIGLFSQSESESAKMLEDGGIPIYETPEQIASVISNLSTYREYLEA